MSKPVSPGVYFREIDLSVYTLRLSTTILGMIGTTPKGPIDTPTLITNASAFTSTFGQPHPDHMAMYSALQFLKNGNQLLFVRVNGLTASLSVADDVDGDLDSAFIKSTSSGPFTFTQLAGATLLGIQDENFAVTAADNKLQIVINDNSPITITLTEGAARTAVEVAAEIDTALSGLGATASVNGNAVSIDTTGKGRNQTLQVLPINNSAYTLLGISIELARGTNDNSTLTVVEMSRPSIDGLTTLVEQQTILSGIEQTIGQVVTQIQAAISAGLQPASMTGTGIETFNIDATNDQISLRVNAAPAVVMALTQGGTQSAQNVVDDLNIAFGLNSLEALASVDGTSIRIGTSGSGNEKSLEIAAIGNDAYTELGLAIGIVNGTGVSATAANVGNRIQISNAIAGQSYGIQVYTNHGSGRDSSHLGFSHRQRSWGYGSSPISETFKMKASNVGTWGNGLTVSVTPGPIVELSTNAATPTDAGRLVRTFDLAVLDGDTIVETYLSLAIHPSDADTSQGVHYFANEINADFQGPTQISGSKYIAVEDTTDNTGLPTIGNYNFSGGDDGLESVGDEDYIGIVDGSTRTGLELFADPERFDVNLLVAPGVFSAAVINKLISVSIGRGDCMCIVDPPFDLDVQQAIDWHNGAGVYNDHQAFNNSYGALYYSWIKEYDPVNSQFVWVPPSGVIAGVYAYSDTQSEVWFAPAGVTRGRVIEAVDVRYSPDQGERDAMYGNRNAINPIPRFSREGVTVWGQRTLQRNPTSLDRVNVRRLILYIRKVLATVYRTIVFEPNDERTRRQVVALTTPFLDTIQKRRGIQEYDVVCDDTNNSPEQVDNNELHVTILIDPTRAAERVHVDIVLTRTGAVFEETTRELAGVV